MLLIWINKDNFIMKLLYKTLLLVRYNEKD